MLSIDVLGVFLASLKFSAEFVSVAVIFCAIVSNELGERRMDTLFIGGMGVEDTTIQVGNGTN